MTPLEAAIRRLDLSVDELGRRTHSRWTQLEPAVADRPVPRAVAARIGALRRGKEARWWRRRPFAARALADELDLDVRELGLGPLPVEHDVRYAFPEFPALRPFDPGGEDPCDISTLGWFEVSDVDHPTWVFAPPGAGRSFVAHWHRVRETAQVVRAGTLAEAATGAVRGRPLLVDLDGADPDRDPAALVRLARLTQVVVLAPFIPPALQPRQAGLKALAPLPPGVFTSVGDGEPKDSTWQLLSWRPAPGWRGRLLDWIAARLAPADAFKDIDALRAWMDRVDPQERWLSTPSDVLSFAAVAHDKGEKRLQRSSLVDVARLHLGAIVERFHRDDARLTTWFRAHASGAVEQLIRARWLRPDLPWSGGLVRHAWATLIPRDLAPPAARDDMAAIAQRLKKAKSKRQRERLIQMIEERANQVSGDEAVSALVESRILRPIDAGGLEITPRWIPASLAMTIVSDVVSSAAASDWGRTTLGPERREVAEEALRSLDDRVFEQLVKRVVREFDRDDIGCVAAVEALFAATALRREDGRSALDAGAAQRLVKLQMDVSVRRFDEVPPGPLTRPGVGDWESLSRRADWVATCWTWSFAFSPPAFELPLTLSWLFPGWLPVSLHECPQWVQWLGLRAKDEESDPRLEQHILAILKRCADAVLPEKIPPLLAADIVVRSPERGWHLRRSHIEELRMYTAQARFESLVEQLGTDEQRLLAGALFHAMTTAESRGLEDLQATRESARAVFEFVFSHIDIPVIVDWLRREPWAQNQHILPVLFRLLPVRLHTAILVWVYETQPARIIDLLHDSNNNQLRIDPEVLGAVGDSGMRAHWLAIRALWKSAPDQAFGRARRALEEGREAIHWFGEAPATYESKLLDYLESRPKEDLPRVRRWLLRRILGPFEVATRAHRLLRRADG